MIIHPSIIEAILTTSKGDVFSKIIEASRRRNVSNTGIIEAVRRVHAVIPESGSIASREQRAIKAVQQFIELTKCLPMSLYEGHLNWAYEAQLAGLSESDSWHFACAKASKSPLLIKHDEARALIKAGIEVVDY